MYSNREKRMRPTDSAAELRQENCSVDGFSRAIDRWSERSGAGRLNELMAVTDGPLYQVEQVLDWAMT
jgi:hypothetical protein